MKTVALLTDQYAADPSYSLNIVMEEQLGALANAGYKPVAVAEDIFKPVRNWTLAEMRHIPSRIPRDNVIRFHDTWREDVDRIHATLDVALDGVDVVITHDMIYQASQLWINMAARRYAQAHPHVTWLNWVHSATPSPVWNTQHNDLAEVQKHFPGSKTVYPEGYSIPRLCAAFRCFPDDIAIVPHSTDVVGYLGLDATVERLVRSRNILGADAIFVYPARLDRGKQVQYIIHVAAAMKRLNRKVHVIVVDFHSTGGDKVTYRNELVELGINLGLAKSELTFTSQFDESWKVSVPRSTVRDLMLLCDVLVQPSVSETYSLVVQEAMLCGAFCVLNFDFAPMREIYGRHAAYFKFSSAIDINTGLNGDTKTNYSNLAAYSHNIAVRIIYELQNNAVLAQRIRIRKERNPDYVFRQFIEPLFSFRDGGIS